MAEKKEGTAKKYLVHKIATELNISKEHIQDFLKKKGIEIPKSFILMKVDEALYQEIIKHFKKDKDVAEKHQKKVSDFKKKQNIISETDKKKTEKEEKPPEQVVADTSFTITDISVQEPPAEEKIEEPKPAVEELISPIVETPVAIPDEKELEKVDITPLINLITEEPVNQPEVSITEAVEKLDVTDIQEVGEIKEESKEKQKVTEEIPEIPELKKEEDSKAHTSLEEIKKQKRGISIVGKINLDKDKEKPEAKPGKTKKEEKGKKPVDEGPVVIDDKPITEKEPERRHKKKRLRDQLKKKISEDDTDIGKKLRKGKIKDFDEDEVDKAIKKTFELIDTGSLRGGIKRKKKKEKIEMQKQKLEEEKIDNKVLKVTEFMTVNDLSKLMNVSVGEVISKFLSLGLMVSINQRLDYEKIQIVADEFGFGVELEKEFKADELADTEDPSETLLPRPPIVTIMGHVDHGKTSLLDYIRKSHIVAGESGGITQHIGAYKVLLPNGKLITFLDTPGHEAFTAMRARGAQVTDIVILVVAADDSVMPQTIEAINHAQAAGVPIIIAINKIDKPGINLDRIYKELAERNILVEKWGGKYQSAEISAKTGKNIDELLEKVLLEAEILDLKANPDRPARGVIIEVKLDKGKGVVATALVRKGTLRVGDPFVAGVTSGKVRAMLDERENKVTEAGPGTPIQVLGFNEMPQAGDEIVVVASDKLAHELSVQRMQIKKAQERSLVRHITLDEISMQIKLGGVKELYVIVKGDVDGSVEALSDSLMKISTPEVKVQVIHKGVGAIVESDVLLAATSNAIIIGFHVRPNINARKLAESERVEIRLYNIIYDVVNDVKSAIEGMLAPEISEEVTATIIVRDVIKVSKLGNIAGCYVQSGKIMRNHKIRIFRNDIVIYEGRIETLKRFKEDVREVDAGYECGIKVENYNDIKVNDIIEGYKVIEKKRKLENVSKN